MSAGLRPADTKVSSPCYEDNRFRGFQKASEGFRRLQEVLGGFNFSGFHEVLEGFKGRRARE